MRLTKSADFALRVLIYLARENKAVTMPELSKRLEISYNHLSKLIQKLRKSNLIKTIQGKYGGVHIHKNPQDITVREVVELMDGPTNLSDCIEDAECCKLSMDCKLKVKLSTVQHHINTMLEDICIAELV